MFWGWTFSGHLFRGCIFSKNQTCLGWLWKCLVEYVYALILPPSLGEKAKNNTFIVTTYQELQKWLQLFLGPRWLADRFYTTKDLLTGFFILKFFHSVIISTTESICQPVFHLIWESINIVCRFQKYYLVLCRLE